MTLSKQWTVKDFQKEAEFLQMNQEANNQAQRVPGNEAIAFLRRAASENARIVSSGDLHSLVISEAQANGRFWVDPETGLGWALIPWELSTMKDRQREANYFADKDMLRQ
jgi:hypothetical protein